MLMMSFLGFSSPVPFSAAGGEDVTTSLACPRELYGIDQGGRSI